MLALAPLKGADPLGGQAGALRQLLLTQSSGFTVPAEFSAEVAAALACAHRWVIVPTAHRVSGIEVWGKLWESRRLAARLRSARLCGIRTPR